MPYFCFFLQHELCEGQLDTKIRTYRYMNLRYGYFWNPGIIKRNSIPIPLPTPTSDLWANTIVKPTKKGYQLKNAKKSFWAQFSHWRFLAFFRIRFGAFSAKISGNTDKCQSPMPRFSPMRCEPVTTRGAELITRCGRNSSFCFATSHFG